MNSKGRISADLDHEELMALRNYATATESDGAAARRAVALARQLVERATSSDLDLWALDAELMEEFERADTFRGLARQRRVTEVALDMEVVRASTLECQSVLARQGFEDADVPALAAALGLPTSELREVLNPEHYRVLTAYEFVQLQPRYDPNTGHWTPCLDHDPFAVTGLVDQEHRPALVETFDKLALQALSMYEGA